jgi:hypothetical protein
VRARALCASGVEPTRSKLVSGTPALRAESKEAFEEIARFFDAHLEK